MQKTTNHRSKQHKIFRLWNILLPQKKFFLFMLTTFLSLQMFAEGFAQPITFSAKEMPAEKAFKYLEKYGYSFVYTEAVGKMMKPVTMEATNATIEEILQGIFADQPVSYQVIDKVVVVKLGVQSIISREE